MTGHRSKAAREIFLTSSSLSFSSFSSSSLSWDDAIELKVAKISLEEQSPKLSNVPDDELSSVVTHVEIRPTAPSPPLKLRPSQLNNKSYDPERIPSSIFTKTADLHWSEVSNDSLFSIKMEECRMSTCCQSNIKPEDILMSGEFLAYSPFLSIKTDDPEEEEEEENISEDEEVKSRETEVTSAKTKTNINHKKKKSFSTPDLCSTNYYTFGLAPQVKPLNLAVVEKKNKKRKKTIKNKKKNKKCCILSWLTSKSSNCNSGGGLYCFKWKKSCCYCIRPPKALASCS